MEETDEIVQEFLVESHENLDQLDRDLVQLEREPGSRELLASVFRTIHTIKGTSGFLAFHRLESVAHVGENLLARLRDGRLVMTPATTDALLAMVDTVRELLTSIEAHGIEGSVEVDAVVARIQRVLDGDALVTEAVLEAPPEPCVEVPVVEPEPALVPAPVAAAAPARPVADADESPAARRGAADASIRVDVELLDVLMRQVGELVLTGNQIVRQASLGNDLELTRASQRLNLIASELQEGVMKTRLQPIDHLWSKLPRVVRDLGAQCGRRVRLEMVGRETELDRTLLEAVKDPLTHLVRNAVDHGLEAPEERIAAGKSPEGLLTLKAYHEGGQVVVEVTDDGAGIDPGRIAAKALEKGLRRADQLAQMGTAEILQLVFAPGFSTAAAVTNVSGRGVGMDVVKTNIESIGGTIEVESVLGTGTTCRLRIPLTLAIVASLTIECAGDRYAIPQVNLLELVALDTDKAATLIEDVGGAQIYRLRGQLLPLVRLTDVLGVASDRHDGHLVIAVLQAEGRRFGLLVDRVLNTEQIVVKPLSTRLKAIGAYSGATILGNGQVALILDVQALARRALRSEVAERAAEVERPAARTGEQHRVLLAGIGEGRRVAVPLSMVTRLEQIPASRVERVGAREVVQYRGAILPLLRLNQHLGAYGATDREQLLVVVYTSQGRSVAMVVDEVVDIVEASSASRSDIDDHGLLGSAVIRDRIIELLDVRAAILAADPLFFSRELDGRTHSEALV